MTTASHIHAEYHKRRPHPSNTLHQKRAPRAAKYPARRQNRVSRTSNDFSNTLASVTISSQIPAQQCPRQDPKALMVMASGAVPACSHVRETRVNYQRQRSKRLDDGAHASMPGGVDMVASFICIYRQCMNCSKAVSNKRILPNLRGVAVGMCVQEASTAAVPPVGSTTRLGSKDRREQHTLGM